MAPFPWDAALHAGLHLLRLKPRVFWRLTPMELAAMTGAFSPPGGRIGRATLQDLMRAFPDG
ncbi:rcc01693 family protein [Agrobacterium sp. ES01]|uniref:rcc01693 family protein n=1 Tax=Agrobacterium sp. ES01 TaxID=3420714 RepID=UPI003D0CCF21